VINESGERRGVKTVAERKSVNETTSYEMRRIEGQTWGLAGMQSLKMDVAGVVGNV
jgi:hypothetical protein